MRIAEAAQRARTTRRALRHYEDLGLIRPGRTRGNARFYSDDLIDRLSMIVQLRDCGLGLREIATILDPAASEDGQPIAEAISARLLSLKYQQDALETALWLVAGRADSAISLS